MSQHEKLDYLIVEEIKSGSSTFTMIFRGAVRAEADRLYEEDRKLRGYQAKPVFRFVDGRLQALRKRGLIEHRKGRGWVVA